MNDKFAARLIDKIAPFRTALTKHSIYGHIKSIEDLRIFMQSHIYAVWDFMSLLKVLQRDICCVEVPWFPSRYVSSRRLINEIVLGEESDFDSQMNCTSHFELYRDAMLECGADTSSIDKFLELLKGGMPLPAALRQADAPYPAAKFVESTWRFVSSGKTHVAAAAFAFGREEVIPDMFRSFIEGLDRNIDVRLDLFRCYLERHIEVDENSHAPLALQMVEELSGPNEHSWQEAGDSAILALKARIALWDGIRQIIESRRSLVA